MACSLTTYLSSLASQSKGTFSATRGKSAHVGGFGKESQRKSERGYPRKTKPLFYPCAQAGVETAGMVKQWVLHPTHILVLAITGYSANHWLKKTENREPTRYNLSIATMEKGAF